MTECTRKQHVNIGSITDYQSLFYFLTADCGKEKNAHNNWKSNPSQKEVCQHILSKWQQLKESILAQNDATTTVKVQHFK